jgi:hypothetical protein
MIPEEVANSLRAQLLSADIMAEPVLFLCSDESQGIHDERIIAKDFARWKTSRKSRRCRATGAFQRQRRSRPRAELFHRRQRRAARYTRRGGHSIGHNRVTKIVDSRYTFLRGDRSSKARISRN